jgi:hypothetical protein
MRYAVFVTTIMLDDGTSEPEYGCSIVGLTTDEEIVMAAQDDFAELVANCGMSEPWLVNEDQLALIEAALPKEKHA